MPEGSFQQGELPIGEVVFLETRCPIHLALEEGVEAEHRGAAVLSVNRWPWCAEILKGHSLSVNRANDWEGMTLMHLVH
jgi:hypothetical protein